MAYQIEYHLQEIRQIKRKMPVWGKALLLTLCLLAGHIVFVLLQTFVGGQWQETVAASEQLVDALKQGTSLQDAVQVFYAELIS